LSQPKPSTPEPTEIAGRYEIIKKLGAGAFGTVYKAKDKILGRLLAIKTIRLEGLAAAGTSLDELVQRFTTEAQVSAQLKHPNIVTIYDIGEAEGVSYLAMEFIDGVGLDKVISQSGKLPLERAASLAAQVADALDFAHQHSVVHRDIKPANIMVESGDRVKVTDFGIAKVTNSADHLTVTGSLLGTPSYMSPEQARGAEIDGRSDLFAVGAVFYEMLAGKKAFRGDSITGLIFKIITEEPTPIREIEPSLPEDVVQILAKALAKAPDNRYQTGRDLADDLLALTRPGSSPTMRQTEIGTSPIRPGAPLAPTISRAATLAGAAPTQMGAATRVAPPTGARVGPPPVPPPGPPPIPQPSTPPARAGAPRPAKSSSSGILIVLGLLFLALMGAVVAAGWYFFLRKPSETQVAQVQEPTTVPTTLAAVLPTTQGPAPSLATPEPTPVAVATPVPTPRAERPRTPPPTQAARPPDVKENPPPSSSKGFLEQEPTEGGDGTQAGEHLAQTYRSEQGRNAGGTFGSRGHFNRRPTSPLNQTPDERPAVAAMRHVMNAEEAFRKQHGRYGNLREMQGGHNLFLDVPVEPESFERKGYRFQLTLAADGFRILAQPKSVGPRAFRGGDDGYIVVGAD
jgi:serine/threonine protein kinase